MKIIALDDEELALEGLMDAIRACAPNAELHGFSYPEDVLAFLQDHSCDVAFLDVEMAGLNGVELAEQLKLHNPDINLIFATGFSRYQGSAFDLHASGYLMKPITVEKVKKELANLRRPVPEEKRIQVQCFGNFEVYLDGIPLEFKYHKTKELLAYLVDRKGALCTNGEIITNLFGDDKPRGLSAQSPEGSAGHAGSGGVCRCHHPAAGQIGHRTPGHPLRLLRLV